MALGKGLDALLGDVSLHTQEGGSVSLPISQVEPGLNQPRKHFDEEALAELAASIEQHGVLQPLTVRRLSRATIRSSPGSAAGGPPGWRASMRSPP